MSSDRIPRVRVLTIAGHDPCGGAGLLADAAVIRAHDAEPLAVPTCLTVQNRHAFVRVEAVDAGYLKEAIDWVFDDGDVHAVKVGMLAAPASVRVVADALEGRALPVVVDPVLSTTAPGYDAAGELAATIREALLPLAALTTPNRSELDRLGGVDAVLDSGAALLTTDGDGAPGGVVADRLSLVGRTAVVFENSRLPRTSAIHGTGCALSSALAVRVAGGASLEDACRLAIEFVRQCIARTPDGGVGIVPLSVVRV